MKRSGRSNKVSELNSTKRSMRIPHLSGMTAFFDDINLCFTDLKKKKSLL